VYSTSQRSESAHSPPHPTPPTLPSLPNTIKWMIEHLQGWPAVYPTGRISENLPPPPPNHSPYPPQHYKVDDGAFAGMAGSGKTTLLQRVNAYLHQTGNPAYILNLDPAVLEVPYEANIDIRDTVRLPSKTMRSRAWLQVSSSGQPNVFETVQSPVWALLAHRNDLNCTANQKGSLPL